MKFVRPNIQVLNGYAYGEQPIAKGIVKLNTNENPYPPSPKCVAVLKSLRDSALNRYPNATAVGLRDRIAELHGLNKENVIVTNGGDEGLRLALTTFVDPGEVVGLTDPTYSLYSVLAAIHNSPTRPVQLDESWSLVEGSVGIWNNLDCKLVFIANPNSPTSAFIDLDEIRSIASHLEGLLVVDEAYVDFINPDSDHDCVSLVRERDDVLIVRTLSKGYSLAGLRVGYLLGHERLIDPILNKTKDSYNVGAIAQQVAAAALDDQKHKLTNIERICNNRKMLRSELEGRGFVIQSAAANFLFVEHPNRESVAGIYESLREAGIFVRYFDTPSLAHGIRITVGTADECQKLLDKLPSHI